MIPRDSLSVKMIEKLIGAELAVQRVRPPVLHVIHEAKGAVSPPTGTELPGRDALASRGFG